MSTVSVPSSLCRYHIWTIGCQMNKADSDRLESALIQLGLSPVESPKDADVIVLNSCVVRQAAEDKVVGMLTSLKPLKSKTPERVIALMGCMVGPKTDALQSRFPYVDVFMRPQDYKPLLRLLGGRLGVDAEGCLGALTPPNASVTAFIPIIHGCDKFCTFCIIPYRRGREVSRPLADIVHEAELLAARGVKEVTLLGQNGDSYGHDLPGAPDLADLLTAVHGVAGLQRVRFLTSHPNDMSQRIIGAVASLPKVCEHFNLPFQAGDDDVLQVMRRGYTRDDYLRLVERIRERVPGVSLSTDLIVGFPGETEAAFQRSLDLVREVEFDKVHVAAYSTRPGTIASRQMEDDVPWAEKKRRLEEVEALQEQVLTRINARLLGQSVEVLVEELQTNKRLAASGSDVVLDLLNGGGSAKKWKGRNRNDKLVFFEDGRDLVGQTVRVRIEKTSPWSLQGVCVG
ncbi:MAG: tRNA (N6-isopentenyl adenosine(37)-C2)-methylthiotransferase MiaB [Chloroflexi bacterium]|nr:tRNA (N6-isopentenyl adenosine(37)-C2)-methylthiotransferase MiaB [Chloroflexota bacterium]